MPDGFIVARIWKCFFVNSAALNTWITNTQQILLFLFVCFSIPDCSPKSEATSSSTFNNLKVAANINMDYTVFLRIDAAI